MNSFVLSWPGLVVVLLAAIGCIYQALSLVLLKAFLAREPARSSSTAGVTVLKPLHGPEPRLKANLASFLAQDWQGSLQMVCGVDDVADPAAAVVAELQRAHPGTDIEFVVGSTRHGANRKVGNLLNMLPWAEHDLIVLSDSDMAVFPDYLSVLVACLARPSVGAVTCLYRGRGEAGFWSRISAGAISYGSLPAMIVGYLTGLARPCMGSTIALSRETLRTIGGLERFADVLADDHAIGEAVAKAGMRVAIPPILLVHSCAEPSLPAFWVQKLRWAATIRGVVPLRHAGSVVTYALPLALIAVPFAPLLGVSLVAASLAIRLSVAAAVDRIAGERSCSHWLLPVIDTMDFAAFLAGFVVKRIDWRGSRLTMERDGRIAA